MDHSIGQETGGSEQQIARVTEWFDMENIQSEKRLSTLPEQFIRFNLLRKEICDNYDKCLCKDFMLIAAFLVQVHRTKENVNSIEMLKYHKILTLHSFN